MTAPLISQAAQDATSELYLGFFGRTVDTSGMLFWGRQIDQGITASQIAADFAQTPEFVAQYGGLSTEGEVNQVYQNILGRSPEAGGLVYWSTAIKNGLSMGQFVWDVVHSAFEQTGTTDAALVQGKIAAAEALVSPVINQHGSTSWNSQWGFGQINAASALSAALGKNIVQTNVDISAGQTQWAITAAHFQDAWSAGYTGKGVVIADIDTGIDLNNAALTHNLSASSWNFVSNNSNVQDDNGHGTASASEMISVSTGSSGIKGGAYDAQLMVLKVLDANGNGTQANLVNAITYAVDHGANVINLSAGGNTPNSAELAALSYAQSHGVVVCMATGNAGASTSQYPASYAQSLTNCIAVGASAQNITGNTVAFASFSNGAGNISSFNYVDAPGVHVLTYGLSGNTQTWTGTSFSSPLVAAEVADVMSAHTGLSASEIVSAVVNTAVNLVGIQTVQI